MGHRRIGGSRVLVQVRENLTENGQFATFGWVQKCKKLITEGVNMAEAITVDAYRKRLAKHMADNSALPPIYYMAFGDGGHNPDQTPKPPVSTATALNHEVLRKQLVSITQEDLFSTTGKGSVEANELIGVAISEAALLDSAGALIGLKTFAPKHKESDERYEISIKLRF